MKISTAKKLLAIMDQPGSAQLMMDCFNIALASSGIVYDQEVCAKLITVLDRKYRSYLPVKEEPQVVNRDIEELIHSIKSGKE